MQRVSLMCCILSQDGDVVFKASTNTDSTLTPELCARQPGALGQGLKLGPRD